MEMLLENKNAVIYGAGGGVGSAIARAFAREGAKVFLAGRTLAKVEAVAKEISAAGGVAEAAQVDALEEHIGKVAEQAGSIDILFNAIGMQDVQGKPLIEMSIEDFTRPITIATRTQFLTARAVARRMVRQACGERLRRNSGRMASGSLLSDRRDRQIRRMFRRRSSFTPGQQARRSRKCWPILAVAPC